MNQRLLPFILVIGVCTSLVGLQGQLIMLRDAHIRLQQVSAPNVDPAIDASVVVEIPGAGYASGVVIAHGNKSYVLTAAHVIDPQRRAPSIKVRRGRDVWHCDVIKHGNSCVLNDDLALLEPRTPMGVKPLSLLPSHLELQRGEPVWYVGNPMGLEQSLERTIVNSLEPFMLVNGNGYFGSSGCAAVVSRGQTLRVAGIIVRLAGDEETNPRAPCACVPHTAIHTFLETVP